MENELKPEHADRVLEFVEQNKNIRASYMLTIARDGESPARSIYHFENAIDAAKLQITREPFEFPTVSIKEVRENINDYQVEDFEIHNYEHHEQIKVVMIA